MISKLRRVVAVGIAVCVVVLTLGRMRLNWTGGPGASAGAEDPGRPSVACPHEGQPETAGRREKLVEHRAEPFVRGEPPHWREARTRPRPRSPICLTAPITLHEPRRDCRGARGRGTPPAGRGWCATSAWPRNWRRRRWWRRSSGGHAPVFRRTRGPGSWPGPSSIALPRSRATRGSVTSLLRRAAACARAPG